MSEETNVIKRQIEACEQCLEVTKAKLIKLREGLAEAEKPKRKHGDFGVEIYDESHWSFQRLILNPANKTGLEIYNEYGEIPSGNKIDIIYGNIFTLLKEWEKDFKGFEKKVYQGGQFNMRIIGDDDVEFFRSGHATANLIEAEEIWMALGTALFTLKRKQE